MRPLKIKGIINKTTPEFERLMKLAIAKKCSNEEEQNLLTQLRNGNTKSVDQLIDSSEIIILRLIKQYALLNFDYNKLIKLSKEILKKLAEKEINNKNRELFLRFRAWYIRQEILRFLDEEKP